MTTLSILVRCVPTLVLLAVLTLPRPAGAYMKLIRQGSDSIEIPNTEDAHGRAVAAGDFDGDGYEDLAMAAPDESNGIGDLYVHGGIVVSYGSAAGLTHLGADWLTVGDLGTDDVRYGQALAVADFDDDGFDDLAVGLPYLDLPLVPATDAGQVWIHYGSALGLPSTPGTILDQEAIAVAGSEDGDLFGYALCTGFFDDDPYPDLAVGAIGEDNGQGAVYYFYSDGSGVVTTGSNDIRQIDLGESLPESNAWLGYALTASDFDGNGTDDLAIGAPKKTVASLTTAGRVYVVFSTAAGLDPAFFITYDALGLGLAAESDAWFGAALTSGQYWTQKASYDLAIGEPQFDQSGQVDAGRAIVLRHDPPPTKASRKATVPADIDILRQGVNGNETAEAGDQFGYALATGNYRDDDIDEIAVGAPFEDLTLPGLGTLFFSGSVTVYKGTPNGPGAFLDTFAVLDVETENDHAIGGETFGQALVFGAVDGSGYQALAIGAPGRDYEDYLDGGTDIGGAGAVYISAPWRQPVDRPHRSSVVWDCDQNIAYAQRPFDLVNPASTTKAMTLLLACEAIEAQAVDEFYPYVVDWSRPPNIGGSLVPLYYGETMEFHNLMKTLMTVSGNDAGYALGDIMTGEVAVWDEYETTLPAFANLMNNRAAQLGLSGSTFLNNPSGMDYGVDPHHRTHAMDWVKLAHGVMQNQCVRDIVFEPCWYVPRDLAGNLDNWLNFGDPVQTNFCNGYVTSLKAGGFPATGIKSGGTPSAWLTGLGAASALGGEVYAAFFGVRSKDDPEGHPGGSRSGTGRDLLAVGRAACQQDIVTPPPPPPPTPFGTMDGLSTQLGHAEGMCFELTGQDDPAVDPANLQLSAVAQVLGGSTASFRLAIVRTSSADVVPTEQISMNYEKISATEGMEIMNMGDDVIDLTVLASHPTGATWTFNLDPGDVGVVPPATVGGQDYQLHIQNTSSRGVVAQLGLHQLGLLTEGQVGDGIAAPGVHQLDVSTDGGIFESDQMCVYLGGQDAAAGSIVGASVHSPNTPTPVEPGLPGVGGGWGVAGLRLLANTPNPFNPSTVLRFELDTRQPVDLRIYNLAGRLVRVLETGTVFAAGAHEVQWNGRDDAGRSVASGIYVVQLRAGGESATQRIALLK